MGLLQVEHFAFIGQFSLSPFHIRLKLFLQRNRLERSNKRSVNLAEDFQSFTIPMPSKN
jgi:hypothetical protein